MFVISQTVSIILKDSVSVGKCKHFLFRLEQIEHVIHSFADTTQLALTFICTVLIFLRGNLKRDAARTYAKYQKNTQLYNRGRE